MVQMDGSHHDWLEGRGPKLVLMGYIDDATNRVYGRFYDYEGTLPAMESFKGYVKIYGFPISVYLDRHTTYKSSKKLTEWEEIAGIEPLSQFERALKELGVKVIHARCRRPREESRGLFGVLQDRLVKEMRLRGIKTKEEANTFFEDISLTMTGSGCVAANETDAHVRASQRYRPGQVSVHQDGKDSGRTTPEPWTAGSTRSSNGRQRRWLWKKNRRLMVEFKTGKSLT